MQKMRRLEKSTLRDIPRLRLRLRDNHRFGDASEPRELQFWETPDECLPDSRDLAEWEVCPQVCRAIRGRVVGVPSLPCGLLWFRDMLLHRGDAGHLHDKLLLT